MVVMMVVMMAAMMVETMVYQLENKEAVKLVDLMVGMMAAEKADL